MVMPKDPLGLFLIYISGASPGGPGEGVGATGDIAESVGITNLKDEVAMSLAQDVEYRIHEIVQEAMKFMRHGKRTKLTVDDINNALRVRNVEPLYGFNSTDPTRFKKTLVGTPATGTTDIFYVEDEELDFETILSSPLPKVPLDISYTAHWLAIEGVQPAIVQNPTPIDAKIDIFNKRIKLDPAATTQPVVPGIKSVSGNQSSPTNASGAGVGGSSAAGGSGASGSGSGGNRNAGSDGANGASSNGSGAEIKPLVKHVLSKELQLYYERITSAVLSSDEVLRATAISSLQNDPGLHQLLPYFVQLVAEKVTQNTRNMSVLESMMSTVRALLDNDNLFIEPYLHQLMPTILTCVVGKRLGETPFENHWSLRSTATDIIVLICQKYGASYHTLQPRVIRTLLRAFLDPEKPLTTHYGAILALSRMGDQVFKTLVVPNLKTYSRVIEPELSSSDMDGQQGGLLLDEDIVLDGQAADESTTLMSLKKSEATHCLGALLTGLRNLIRNESAKSRSIPNTTTFQEVREPLAQAIGETLARALLKDDDMDQNVAGIIVVIESC
ncbi:hypothetical protein BGW38_010763 [Lunasporangiospora selenospora]|uniref:TBP-associated factor 6 n=1 Tax=Lunasporangiospora selenospora TaxID=979761 RepID=A0A9P6FVS5_9FUNG|nr:hypothetical protein BGW38_010763 [Lunasporangiospora selenospora]